MARRQWAELICFLACLFATSAIAQEPQVKQDEAVVLETEFLEFLGEAKKVDGEYHDPLQMQDWVQQEVVDAGQQQEDKAHE